MVKELDCGGVAGVVGDEAVRDVEKKRKLEVERKTRGKKNVVLRLQRQKAEGRIRLNSVNNL